MRARHGCQPGGVSGTLSSTGHRSAQTSRRTTEETIHHEEPAMLTNPHLILDLHAARVADLRAEAAHDRLVRALRRHASTADIDPGVRRGAGPPVVAAAPPGSRCREPENRPHLIRGMR
jgi:hypothetical protein